MPFQQIKDFNPAKGGNVKGMCLRNVRQGYGIAGRYLNATTAWNRTQQHRDRNIPAGVEVPLFYTFYTKSGNEGHINVRLADGRVWSDGQYFASVEDYEARQTPDFIGWGESINNVQVIAYVPDLVPPANASLAGRVGQDVILSRSVSSWRIYKPGTKTEVARLNPKKNGGRYQVIDIDSLPNRVIINSPTFGRVSLPIDSDASFVKAA